MADEADHAQTAYDQFFDQGLKARKLLIQASASDPLPLCANDCGNRCFITEKGTRTRICQECYEEQKASGA